MISLLRLARALRSDERGIALPVTFGVGLVMLMLVAGSMSVTMSNVRKTNTDEDWNGALTAAYAGVEEYQSRLANDSTYQKYGNPSAPFSSGTGSTLTLPVSPNVNDAFGIGTAGTWASVRGSDSTASFRYEIDNSDYQDKGILHIRSTGRVGSVTRSIVVDLKQDGFIDYLWFTNYEVQDPAYSGVTTLDANNKSICERYAWASPARDTSSSAPCGNIQFGASDVFSGPVRSNDRLLICETTFMKSVLTSSITSPIFKTSSGCDAPDFRVGTATFAPTIDMPPTNTEMKKETRSDLPAEVPRPGCLYTGPTVVNFETSGGVPKMRVYSPWTVKTNVTGTNSGTAPSECGIPGTGVGALGSPGGALLNVLERNLVYVQGVPAACSGAGCDPNAPASGTYLPNGYTCTSASGSGSGKIPAGWQFVDTSTSAVVQKFPAVLGGNNEVTPSGGGAAGLIHYGCKAGDLYVKGTLGGQITLAADNYIYVTGDITYIDKASDMLGLVGQNAVFVWNPVRWTGSAFASLNSTTNRTIHAAILSVGHTFQVQNYERGARGTLTILGAIAQKFRGTVGQGTNGFVKNYEYDERFKFTAPPKFLTPVSTTYGVTQFASVPSGFTATGATGP